MKNLISSYKKCCRLLTFNFGQNRHYFVVVSSQRGQTNNVKLNLLSWSGSQVLNRSDNGDWTRTHKTPKFYENASYAD